MASIPGIAGPGAGYPQWGVAVGSPGQHVTKVTNSIAKYLMESVSFPSKVYFFTSQQAADDWVSGNGGQTFVPGTKTPLNAANNTLNAATSAAGGTADFLARLSSPNTWVRVGEFVVGALLIGLGLNAILHNPAGKIAKAVPKVVPV